MADNELDVRQLRRPDKHPPIFATYADLPVGGSPTSGSPFCHSLTATIFTSNSVHP